MPGNPRECRQHAARCAVLAAEAKTEHLKATYLNLSRTWEALARELEHAEALVAAEMKADMKADIKAINNTE